jgi:hypothetical protein
MGFLGMCYWYHYFFHILFFPIWGFSVYQICLINKYMRGWYIGCALGFQPRDKSSILLLRATVLYNGGLVLTGTHLLCTQKFGVRFPGSPPRFRLTLFA